MRNAFVRLAVLLAVALVAGCAQAPTVDTAPTPRVDTLKIEAPGLSPAPLRVRVYLPPRYDAHGAGYPVLYVNDGQDMEAVGLPATLASLYADHAIRPVIVVAIDMPPDRMAAYGLSDRAQHRSLVAQTKYGPVGADAQVYSEWVAKTLVPYVEARYRTGRGPASRGILGWSLGALNAFNLGWQYPELFGRVGAFSPSFWLAADRASPASIQATRLAQVLVDASQRRVGLKLFFAVGGAEEMDDRDGDGVNDAVDDTRDLIEGWHDGARTLRGLAQLGYRIDMEAARSTADRADVGYVLLADGHHDQASWGRMLPLFLRWAYAPSAR